MITPDAGQATLATKAAVRQVALVHLRTYSDVRSLTVAADYYLSTVPARYQWSAGTTIQFQPLVKQVSAIVRGFPHIPDGVTASTRDGIAIDLDVTTRGGSNVWASALQFENLHGAVVEVATLLVDEAAFEAPGWFDFSALGAVATMRWRGEVSSVSDLDWESGRLTLNCDVTEPTLDWPTARDPLLNDPRDTGKRYPMPFGYARQVELVGREVGHATTLAAEVAATGTTAWSITDGEGFPTSGTFTVQCGDELVTVNGATSTPTSLVITARAALGSTAAKHPRGATVVEYVREARFVLSAREVRSIGGLFWQIPSGQRVRLEPGTFGFNPAASEIETGERLAVVTLAREELAAALEVVASVIQQPTFASATATAKLAFSAFAETNDATASVGPANRSDPTINIDNPAGFRVDQNVGNDNVAVFWTPSAVIENPTAKVLRVRPVFDLRVDSVAGNTTNVYYEVDSHTISGSILFTNKTLLVGQTGTQSTRQQLAGAWMTPSNPDVFTLADLAGSGPTTSGGFRAAIYLDMSGGSGGEGFFCYAQSSYWEVEIEPPPPSADLPVDVAAAWAVGNGLRLVADVNGIVSRAGEAAVASLDFSTTTGWSGSNCTISVQTIGSRQGIRLASPSNVNCDLVRTGLTLDWSAAGGTVSFEVYITAAFKDKLSATDGRFVELKVGTNGTDMTAYPFSPGDLIDDGWTTLTADLAYHYSRVTLGAGATLSNVTRIELGPRWDSTSGAPQIHFRNVRFMTRTLIDHPIDVATFVVEQLAGRTGAVDASAAATAKTNLPSVKAAGDLRNMGEGLAEILARLGFESRTNWVALEASSGTIYRPLTPSTSWNFPSSARTLSTFRGLRLAMRQLEEIATQFSALWDYRPEPNGAAIEAFRKVTRSDETVNEISARVATANIDDAQKAVGVRESLPQEFRMIGDLASLVEVWAYYVKEAIRFPRTNGRRFSLVVPFSDGWDLEPGDIVTIATPWDGSSVKCRITRTAFPPDAPGIGLSLEQVI